MQTQTKGATTMCPAAWTWWTGARGESLSQRILAGIISAGRSGAHPAAEPQVQQQEVQGRQRRGASQHSCTSNAAEIIWQQESLGVGFARLSTVVPSVSAVFRLPFLVLALRSFYSVSHVPICRLSQHTVSVIPFSVSRAALSCPVACSPPLTGPPKQTNI